MSDLVSQVVAEECAHRTGGDHEQQRLLTLAGGDTAEDHGRLARNDGDHRIEQGDGEDDEEEPPLSRRILEPTGEILDPSAQRREDAGEQDGWHPPNATGSRRSGSAAAS
jgi:hypothetical protein